MATVKKKPVKKKLTPKSIVPVLEAELVLPKKEEGGIAQMVTSQTMRGGTRLVQGIMLPPKVVAQIADQVAKAVYDRVPRRTSSGKKKTPVKVDVGFVLDTSAIIDGRIFDLARVGAFFGNFTVISGVLDELKNIADSKDDVKKERGKRALRNLEEFKRIKDVKLLHAEEDVTKKAVDERIIDFAKKHKGRILTCDFNLSKKARITGVISIDLYEMANILKTTAVPGEEFFVKVVQRGKGANQGVGYLPDGTMVVIEQGENQMDKTLKVLISRVIQTDAGRIFFAKITQ